MERNWKQLAGVFLMGVLMPGLAVRIGGAIVPARGQAETTLPAESTAAEVTEAPAVGQAVSIPVKMADGTVISMELEEYLVGVVIGEMPASFEPEALKAQAVVARTFTLRCAQRGDKHTDAAVCTDSRCCQSYLSVADYYAAGADEADVEKIRSAVQSTAGQVLTYNGELIEATYFSCSGGRTEDAAAVWGGEVPYLQSVESPGEENAAVYTETVTFTASEFASLLGRKLTGSPESWFGVTTYTEGGGVATTVLAGRSYTGTELRSLLSLNSTVFTMKAEGNTITVTTTGKGHRVGMSQYGADAMAVLGSTYEEILAHYYQGTRIDKIDALG